MGNGLGKAYPGWVKIGLGTLMGITGFGSGEDENMEEIAGHVAGLLHPHVEWDGDVLAIQVDDTPDIQEVIRALETLGIMCSTWTEGYLKGGGYK